MSTELSISNTNDLTCWDDENKLPEIRKIFAPKLSDLEFKAFVGMGKQTQLNPFLREIWAIKYADNAPAQIFISRDGYRKSAQRNPNYDYHQADAIYENDTFEVLNGIVKHSYKLMNRGALIGGYCCVQRRNSSKPMYVYVNLKDYDKKQSCWNNLKATMISKVAEAQCLRMAFQEQFSGTLSEYEEPIIIQGVWTSENSSRNKFDNLLEKKGFNNNANNTTINNDFMYPDNDNLSNNLHTANNNSKGKTSERNKNETMVTNGTQENSIINETNAPVLCSKAQLEVIENMMIDLNFDHARKLKALHRFNVNNFEELSEENADKMIEILYKTQ